MRRLLAPLAVALLATLPATAQQTPPGGAIQSYSASAAGGTGTPTGSVNDLQTNAGSGNFGHLTPGTGVATALGINKGTAGAVVVSGNNIAIDTTATVGSLNASPGLKFSSSAVLGQFGLGLSPTVSGEPFIEFDGYGAGGDPFIAMFLSAGTVSSPTAVASGTLLGTYSFGGAGAGNLGAISANITATTSETFSTGHAATTGELWAIDSSTETLTSQLKWGGAGGVQIGTPTGGAKGNGTLNAHALYVDGVAISAGGGCTVSGAAGAIFNNGSSACITNTDMIFATGILSLGTNTSELGGVKMFGGTSGSLQINPPAVAGTASKITFPAGITDFSGTGGTSQVVKQVTTGAPFTVGQLAFTDISGNITAAQMLALPSTDLYVGNGSNVPAAVALSGDATLSNTGAITIANLAVTNAKIANSTIDLTAKVTGALPAANMASCTATVGGAVPTPPNNTTTFLRGDCTFGTPAGSGTVTSVSPGAGAATSNIGGTTAITTTGTMYSDASYYPFFLGGLTLSNDGTTPNTIIDVAAGAAVSDDNIGAAGGVMMRLGAFTKTTGGTWIVGSTNAGLDTGTIAASTVYHVFVIERPDTSVVDVLISLSATSPTMPTNYTKKRRIGSFKTDGSSNIIKFVQRGTTFWFNNGSVYATFTIGTTASLITLPGIPTGVILQPICRYSVGGTGASVLLTSPDELDELPTVTTPFSAAPGFDQLDNSLTAGDQNTACPYLTTNTSGQIRARATAASTTLAIVTRGWIE